MGSTEYRSINALIKKAIQGDKKAFEELCERDAQNIIYLCTKLMGDTPERDDAAQEVFIKVQTLITTLRAPEAYYAWIQRIVNYVCRNMRRQEMNHADALPIEDFPDLFAETDEGVLPEEYVQNKEMRHELMSIIDNLPDRARTCILMRYFSGLSLSEIADVLEMNENAVKASLFFAREKIRKELKARDENLYLNSATLLPMAALAGVFREDMNEIITPTIVRRCLRAAGIGTNPLLRFLALPFVGNLLVSAACIGVAVITLACLFSFASFPPAGISGSDVPQHLSEGAPAGGMEDMAPEQGAAPPETSPPGLLPSRPGGGAPVNDDENSPDAADDGGPAPSGDAGEAPQDPTPQNPTPQNPQPPPTLQTLTAVRTIVKGRVEVTGLTGTPDTANLLAGRYRATILQNGVQLAAADVERDGGFQFDGLMLRESGAYTLRLACVYSHGLGFAPENPDGTVSLYLEPGREFTLADPLLLADNDDPAVSLYQTAADGKRTAVNPSKIEIHISDATTTTVSWSIQPQAGGTPVTGTTRTIESNVLSALPAGHYIATATVTDAAGNTGTASVTLYVT